MKRLTDILPSLLLMLLASAALTACDGTDNDTPADQLIDCIVTFTGNSGSSAGFEYQAVDDSPMIYLTTPGNLNEKEVKPGTRLLMRYRMPAGTDPFKGGNVELIGLQRVLTDTVATLQQQPTLNPLYLLTIQRSGEYLNVQSMMPATKKRNLEVTATPLPDADGLLDLYVSPTYGDNTANAYDTNTWASLWIGPVWQRTDITGVRVHIANTNNTYRKEFTFKKHTL